MKILVLGTPFSGAARMCNTLRLAGYKVGNGTVERDGMVNMILVWPGISVQHYLGYEHIFHMVSNPITVLARMRSISPPRTNRNWAEAAYISTNEYIASIAEARIRVDHVEEDWPTALFKPKQFSRYRDNGKPGMPVKLSVAVKQMAKEYGYVL
jgi:hypothetical protein